MPRIYEDFKRISSPVLNWTLLTNPINWIIVPLIVILGGIALGLVFHPANHDDTSGNNNYQDHPAPYTV